MGAGPQNVTLCICRWRGGVSLELCVVRGRLYIGLRCFAARRIRFNPRGWGVGESPPPGETLHYTAEAHNARIARTIAMSQFIEEGACQPIVQLALHFVGSTISLLYILICRARGRVGAAGCF
ncbi:unnamed protein product [Ectocarpus fasciculatus]